MVPYLLARAVRRLHGISTIPTDDDLARLARHYRLRIVEEPKLLRSERIQEVYLQSPGERSACLHLRPGLPRVDRRWIVAHSLIHHLSHEGNHLFASGLRAWETSKQERQANLAAGFLFWCHLTDASPCLTPSLDEHEIAELAEAPLCEVQRWHWIRREIGAVTYQARLGDGEQAGWARHFAQVE